MSIILKALKKVQEQETEHRADDRSDSTRSAGAGSPPAALASASSRAPSTVRHSFGFTPKALLGVLVVLGIVTTGWFAGKIYGNLKVSPDETVSQPVADAEETVEYVRAIEVAPPQDTPNASQTLPASPPEELETTAPLETEPASTVSPEPQLMQVPVAQLQPHETQPSPVADETSMTMPVEPTPISPPAKEAAPEVKGRPELKINAIAWKNEEPRAIVNMQSVYEGDTIEGAKVLAIGRKIIVFEYAGETFEVRF